MIKIKPFTVVRDDQFSGQDDVGCVRLLVNTDIPYEDESFDLLADMIESIEVTAVIEGVDPVGKEDN